MFQPAGIDFRAIVRQPTIWLRIGAIFCSVIVFATIADKGFFTFGNKYCVFNLKDDACNLGIAVGVISFLGGIVLLVHDVIAAAVREKSEVVGRILVLIDVGFSGAWSLMWFICFCFLVNEWRVTNKTFMDAYSTATKNNARAAIAFSFFSVVLWGILTGLAIRQLMTILRGGDSSSYEKIEGSTSASNYGAASSQPIATGEQPSAPIEQP